ncbi:hypothetical protein LL912_00605 [Niabella sp. CC-SYL272]|uniref:hypothetical protein n=1 Tax=Niabella agricola TaxID=2891571 RepID=UPI001F3CC1B8|nr:hypothetical protein [Niabella agricola]MCF3107267.1 hypothetical protein [Niabella agricola]
MAMTIQNSPVLKGASAKAFIKKADTTMSEKKETVSFKKQYTAAQSILKKAKMR